RFANFDDFLDKVDAACCNKRLVESLIKAGAFDSLGETRRSLLNDHTEAIDECLHTKRNEAIGQFDLFGDADDGARAPFRRERRGIAEWDKAALLGYEREMLGLYVSDHPLFGIEHILAAARDCPIAALTSGEDRPDGSVVIVGGLLTSVQRKVTRRGDAWAIAVLEDLEGAIEVMLFPAVYQQCATQLAEDTVVLIRGRVDRREDAPKLVAMELTVPDLADGPRGPVIVTLAANRCTPPVVDRLKEVLAAHPGSCEVHLRLLSGARTTVLRLDERMRVSPSPSLMGDLKALLGAACLGG
nr:DNA polymerase III subunit alpha [Acidothermales bacterium]